jgi:cysteinyl-tRNA synthetase
MASGGGPSLDVASYDAKFTEAMEDDLNTPVALKSLLKLSNEISSASGQGMDVIEAQSKLKNLASSLGLSLLKDGPEKRVVDGWSIHQRQFAI